MDKNEAQKIIFNCAKLYQQNFVNKNLLFVCRKNSHINIVETVFLTTNFLHMTGVKFEEGKEISPRDFYELCTNKRLGVNQFIMADNHTTEMKLMVLPGLLCKDMSARMMGNFNSNKPMLYTDKLIGGVCGGIGFVKNKNSDFYFPNTVLKEDIRNLVDETQQIIAVLRKDKTDNIYTEVIRKASQININDYIFPDEYKYIQTLLDFG